MPLRTAFRQDPTKLEILISLCASKIQILSSCIQTPWGLTEFKGEPVEDSKHTVQDIRHRARYDPSVTRTLMLTKENQI